MFRRDFKLDSKQDVAEIAFTVKKKKKNDDENSSFPFFHQLIVQYCQYFFFFFFFFFDLGFTALSRIFHLYRADRSSKVGENRSTRRKTT